MDFRAIIKQNFGVDLPIKSGYGSGFDTAVVLQPELPDNDYAATEQAYLKYMALLRNIEWKIISQSLQTHEGKIFDVMKIETIEKIGKETEPCMETHYFDISECWAYRKTIG